MDGRWPGVGQRHIGPLKEERLPPILVDSAPRKCGRFRSLSGPAAAAEAFLVTGFAVMTIDKSLKVKLGSIRSRNVLTRGERISKHKEAEKWKEGDSVIGLPKVRVVKISLKKK